MGAMKALAMDAEFCLIDALERRAAAACADGDAFLRDSLYLRANTRYVTAARLRIAARAIGRGEPVRNADRPFVDKLRASFETMTLATAQILAELMADPTFPAAADIEDEEAAL